jgi:Tol biopolymer transport system component
MGEVYRARDTRLERTVAVKVLPQTLSASAEVRQRFEREARTISQLSHPHICALYDVGREQNTEYLVMELLEGETLSQRLTRGALSLPLALRYGIEIADALDKAHRQGIVHRDLKPANVMLTKSGVKLLDFGLAKAMAPATPASSLTALPTQQNLTQEGTILGTFQYMAPEQLEGKDADARTDIFALGCVLYEMASGRKAFSGVTTASLITAIMSAEPPSIVSTQPTSPPALDRVVTTCLAKDPEDRWQSAADVKRELQWIAEGPSGGVPAPPIRARGAWLPWTIAVAASLLAAALAVSVRTAAPVAPRMELSIVLPERTVPTDFLALSPDGRTLAFVGIAENKCLIRVRDLASSEMRALPGTDSAEYVFWSPDGRSLGFVARGKLRRIDLATGAIESIADAEAGRGGSWAANGDILFAQKAAGCIYRVSSSGGPVTPVTTLQKGDLLHRWPQFLPGGKTFLFYAKTTDTQTTGTYLATLGEPGRRLVLRNGATGVFAPPDTLLYGRTLALLAQRFDPKTGTLSGSPETIARPIMRAELGSFIDLFSVASNGVVVFRVGTADRQLTWVDRKGNVLERRGQPGVIMSVTLSPDEREAAISVRTPETGTYTSSLLDLARDVSTPLADTAAMPVWAPDGHSLLYRREGGNYEIRRRNAHGDPKDESLGLFDSFVTPHSISADGNYALFTRMGGNFDVGVIDLRGGKKPEMILGSPYDERCPHFSPDGHWYVYSSDEPGQTEIFVRRFPSTEEVWRVSTSGGQQPSWSHDGKEIFFVSPDGHMMAAPVTTSASGITIGAPQPLFAAPVRLNSVSNQYAASFDGQRFLVARLLQDFDVEPFRVLLNWRAKS